MNERSFFDFDSQPDDSNQFGSLPWRHRFQDFTRPNDDHTPTESVIEGAFDVGELPTHGEIIELIETLHASDSSPFLNRPSTDRPHSVHLPEHYEAGYAYPLVVWFHGDGSSESEVASVMPNISERNYIGLALRGNIASGQGFGWSTSGDDLQKLIADVESLVLSLRREYHIHSERIYLAGFGSGASAAMELILQKPEWFGGAACFCGSLPELHVSQRRIHELRNKRVLLATSTNSRNCKVKDVVAAGRVLYASGMQIGTRVYQDAGTTPSSKMLSDINHWLMDDVCSAVS
jgi:phospholipase/carboxylesterase